MNELPLVLFVEDDEDVRELTTYVLEDAGYAVHGVCHGREAVDAMENGLRPHAIILDLAMPVMTGWSFWDWMQVSPFASVPVVIFTSTRHEGPMGASRVLHKGRGAHELLDALRALVTREPKTA
ncbi:MAG: response regulator [Deltaproteobacteria bacterium]|nr:response regulator [Deltaproteobacteria bacterium]